jgi:hypothetical protein
MRDTCFPGRTGSTKTFWILGLIEFNSETEHPEQAAPAIQIAGNSTTFEDTISLLCGFNY